MEGSKSDDAPLDIWDDPRWERLFGANTPIILLAFVVLIGTVAGFIAAGSYNQGAQEVDLRGDADRAIERSIEAASPASAPSQ